MEKQEDRYKDLPFAKDWQIDEERRTATHKSGLRISVESKNDNNYRLVYHAVPVWYKMLAEQGITKEADIENLQNNLSDQFIKIYKKMPQLSTLGSKYYALGKQNFIPPEQEKK